MKNLSSLVKILCFIVDLLKKPKPCAKHLHTKDFRTRAKKIFELIYYILHHFAFMCKSNFQNYEQKYFQKFIVDRP